MESLEPAQGKETMTALSFRGQETPMWFALLSSCLHICTSVQCCSGGAAQLAGGMGGAGVTRPFHQTLQDSQFLHTRGRMVDRQRGHGVAMALLNQWCQARVGPTYRDRGDRSIGFQVLLNPITYNTCSWMLRKQHYSSHRIEIWSCTQHINSPNKCSNRKKGPLRTAAVAKHSASRGF